MDEEEGKGVGPEGKRFSPQNGTPAIILTGFNALKLIVERYGWFLLIVLLGIMYLYKKYKPYYDKWKQNQEHLRDAEERKNNPDHAYAIQLSMEESRRKLQNIVSANNEINRFRQNELAEQKRLQKIEEWEKHKQGKGYHSKSKPQEVPPEVGNQLKPKRKNDFRPAFNPLSGGGGGSSGYRPSRRNGSGGG